MGSLFGRGSVLNRGNHDGPPETFSSILGITKIDGPKIAGKPVTITSHGSPGNSEEYLGTTIDVSWSLTINFDPADAIHQGLRTDSLAQSTRNFTYKKAGEITTAGTFAAIVKSWNESEDPSKQRVATFDLVVTGTYTSAHA